MSTQKLNADNFIYSSTFYNYEFEYILSQLIACYYLMKSNNCTIQNNENLIRDTIVNNYLMNNDVRKQIDINNYLFHREIPTINNIGRVDIYIATQNTFQDTNAYYIIECKRLDGKKNLNKEYIAEGIIRFTNENKYPFYNDTAGMIGFVVEKIDINKNVLSINELLKQEFSHIDTEETVTGKTIVSNFEYSYFSKHKVNNASKIIYHLMFDFSDNISL